MTAKKVWGVIIIIVGIFLFFSGAKKYYEADFYGNEIKSMGKFLSETGGSQFFDSKRYQKLVESEKANGVVGSLFGIAMAIGGTLLLRVKKKKHTPHNYNFDNDFRKIDD
jgi:hypothetical protein